MNIPIDLLRERMIGGWVGSSDNRKYFEPIAGKTSQLRHGRIYIIDEAELLEVLDPSSERIEPKCEAYGRCGGCVLQHVSSERQRD